MSSNMLENTHSPNHAGNQSSAGSKNLWMPKLGLSGFLLKFLIEGALVVIVSAFLYTVMHPIGFGWNEFGWSLLFFLQLPVIIWVVIPLLATVVLLYAVTLYLAGSKLPDAGIIAEAGKGAVIGRSLIRILTAGIPALGLATFYVFGLNLTTFDFFETALDIDSANPAVFLRNIIIVAVSIVVVRLMLWWIVRAKSFSNTEKYLRGIY